jgi:hypothetical protein
MECFEQNMLHFVNFVPLIYLLTIEAKILFLACCFVLNYCKLLFTYLGNVTHPHQKE